MPEPRPSDPESPYRQAILAVQRYIEAHLDRPLPLEELAEVAGFSPYHFSRIYVAQVGETVAAYVRRLKMQRAAQRLSLAMDPTVLEIALDAGYGSHEAFTRAFRSHFGITPTEYRACVPPTKTPSLPRPIVSTDTTAYEVRIERHPARRVLSYRHTGPYLEIAETFGRLGAWAGPKGLFATPHGKMVGVFHDDPSVVPPEKLRSDAGIFVTDDVTPAGDEMSEFRPVEGRYAITTVRGWYDKLPDAYQWFYATWLPQSGEKPGDQPPFEVYVEADHSRPETCVTEICVLLKD